jgi:hypothetical protein
MQTHNSPTAHPGFPFFLGSSMSELKQRPFAARALEADSHADDQYLGAVGHALESSTGNGLKHSIWCRSRDFSRSAGGPHLEKQ